MPTRGNLVLPETIILGLLLVGGLDVPLGYAVEGCREAVEDDKPMALYISQDLVVNAATNFAEKRAAAGITATNACDRMGGGARGGG